MGGWVVGNTGRRQHHEKYVQPGTGSLPEGLAGRPLFSTGGGADRM